MNLLLDTHVLLWAAGVSGRLPDEGRALLEQRDTQPVFSAASIWEVAIKSGIGRPDFHVDPHLLRRGLLEHGYTELAVTGAHAVAVVLLPPLHKDPFDRILVAQAQVEGVTLLTADKIVGRYPGPIQVL
ncbi:MAG: type II toxin-antitoxin system VapC family toxin [Deltaproteobacteria bacterium]|nr:type II toxin-antitoxin system VapC family toxin [Deltaproteobacteria bacterium]